MLVIASRFAIKLHGNLMPLSGKTAWQSAVQRFVIPNKQ